MKRIEEVLNVDEVYTMVEEGVTKPLKVRLFLLHSVHYR